MQTQRTECHPRLLGYSKGKWKPNQCLFISEYSDEDDREDERRKDQPTELREQMYF